MKTYLATLQILGTHVEGSNPLPIFRDPVKDKASKSDGTLSKEEMYKLGDETGYRVLPYRLYDKYDREKKPIQLKVVVLENDIIRVQSVSYTHLDVYKRQNLEQRHPMRF